MLFQSQTPAFFYGGESLVRTFRTVTSSLIQEVDQFCIREMGKRGDFDESMFFFFLCEVSDPLIPEIASTKLGSNAPEKMAFCTDTISFVFSEGD